MRTRSKRILHERKLAGNVIWPQYPPMPPQPYYTGVAGQVASEDISSDELSPGPPYHWVNPLLIQHVQYMDPLSGSMPGRHWCSGVPGTMFECVYDGHHWTESTIPVALSGDAGSVNQQSLDALGATGWSKFKPVKPIADTGVMLGESRELPGQLSDAVKGLKQLATHPLKSVRNMSWVSNQHLAVQFGWLPLMSDLQKLYKAVCNTNSWFDRVRKYNGQWEHRGGTVAQGSGSSKLTGCLAMLPAVTWNNSPPEGVSYGDLDVSWGYRVWFSAWFKYYIGDFDSLPTTLRLSARIYGLTNTPTIVWNLLPWSWLVDWFSNVGDNIDNLLPIDGLVAKMPCIMRHCWTKYSGTVTQRYKNYDGSYSSFTAWCRKEIETKGRGPASPFGFGLSGESLSLRQLSILAALGIQHR